jgi:V/A-type H+-transporting ATPase subunit F
VSHRLRVVCRAGVADGFELAGVRTLVASSGTEAAAWLARLREEAEVGVVFLEQELLAALPERARRDLERATLPIVVPFPSPRREEAPPSAEDRVLEILRRAVGYRVRLP